MTTATAPAAGFGAFPASVDVASIVIRPRRTRRYVLVCADGDERRRMQREFPGYVPEGYDVCMIIVVRTASTVLRGYSVDGFELTQRARWSRWGLDVQQQLEQLHGITEAIYGEPATT